MGKDSLLFYYYFGGDMDELINSMKHTLDRIKSEKGKFHSIYQTMIHDLESLPEDKRLHLIIQITKLIEEEKKSL